MAVRLRGMKYLRAIKNLILFLAFGLFYGLRLGFGIWLWCIYTGGWTAGRRPDPVDDDDDDDFDPPSHH